MGVAASNMAAAASHACGAPEYTECKLNSADACQLALPEASFAAFALLALPEKAAAAVGAAAPAPVAGAEAPKDIVIQLRVKTGCVFRNKLAIDTSFVADKLTSTGGPFVHLACRRICSQIAAVYFAAQEFFPSRQRKVYALPMRAVYCYLLPALNSHVARALTRVHRHYHVNYLTTDGRARARASARVPSATMATQNASA